MENLNEKVWYRLLKVVFIITFILIQIIGVGAIWSSLKYEKSEVALYFECYYTSKEISPETWNNYRNSGTNITMHEMCGDNLSEENSRALDAGKWIYQDKYNVKTLVGFSLLTFLVISFIFWLISRVSLYIYAKDKFFSGKMINEIRKAIPKKINDSLSWIILLPLGLLAWIFGGIFGLAGGIAGEIGGVIAIIMGMVDLIRKVFVKK
jgi:hypothetical protein